MASPLLTSIIFTFGFFAIAVRSQNDVNHDGSQHLPPQSPLVSPPPPSPIPPPPPPPPPPPDKSPPPPLSPPFSPPPPPPPSSTRPPPPPPRKYAPLSPPKNENEWQNSDQFHQSSNRKLNPPPKQTKLNLGKKIGLLFAGIAVLLQVIVISFLVIKRRQLLKTESGSPHGNTEFVTLD